MASEESDIVDLLFCFSIGAGNLSKYTRPYLREVRQLLASYLVMRPLHADFPPIVDVITVAFKLVRDVIGATDEMYSEGLRSRLLPASIMDRPLLPHTEPIYAQLLALANAALWAMREDRAAIENFPEAILALLVTAHEQVR